MGRHCTRGRGAWGGGRTGSTPQILPCFGCCSWAHDRPTYRSKLKQISFIPWDSIPAQQVRSSTSTRHPGLPLPSLPTCCTSLCRHPRLPPHQPVLSHEPAVPSLSQASVELRSAQTQHLCPVSHLRGMLSWLETHTPPRRSAAMDRVGGGGGGVP